MTMRVLNRQDLVRTEFHVHTKASHDSLMGRRALLAICRARRVSCVAITDHNEVSGAIAFKPYLEARGVHVIVGEEIFTSEGEIIGLFLKDRIEPGMTPEETIAEIRSQGGVVYVPHPYDEKRRRTVLSPDAQGRLAPEFDCMEVHNGRNVSASYSERQASIASELGIPAVVGGDSHCFFEVGRNVCVTEEPFTRERFQRVLPVARFETSACHPLAHNATRLVRLAKMIGRGDFRGVHRVLARKLAR